MCVVACLVHQLCTVIFRSVLAVDSLRCVSVAVGSFLCVWGRRNTNGFYCDLLLFCAVFYRRVLCWKTTYGNNHSKFRRRCLTIHGMVNKSEQQLSVAEEGRAFGTLSIGRNVSWCSTVICSDFPEICKWLIQVNQYIKLILTRSHKMIGMKEYAFKLLDRPHSLLRQYGFLTGFVEQCVRRGVGLLLTSFTDYIF